MITIYAVKFINVPITANTVKDLSIGICWSCRYWPISVTLSLARQSSSCIKTNNSESIIAWVFSRSLLTEYGLVTVLKSLPSLRYRLQNSSFWKRRLKGEQRSLDLMRCQVNLCILERCSKFIYIVGWQSSCQIVCQIFRLVSRYIFHCALIATIQNIPIAHLHEAMYKY